MNAVEPSLHKQAQVHIALLESYRMFDGHANDATIKLLKRLVAALPNAGGERRDASERTSPADGSLNSFGNPRDSQDYCGYCGQWLGGPMECCGHADEYVCITEAERDAGKYVQVNASLDRPAASAGTVEGVVVPRELWARMRSAIVRIAMGREVCAGTPAYDPGLCDKAAVDKLVEDIQRHNAQHHAEAGRPIV